jgi:hypothetical protein
MSWIGKTKGLNAWRNHPLLRANSVWEMLPGLKKALVVFSAYCVVDLGYQAIKGKKDDHHGGHGHDDSHGGHGGHDNHSHGGDDGEKEWVKTIGSGRAVQKPLAHSAAHFRTPFWWNVRD